MIKLKVVFSVQRFAKKINLTKRGDVYSNSAAQRIIYALEGNDSIYNERSNYVTVKGGKGNDRLYNNGASYVLLNGDSGNDYIHSADGYSNSVYSSSYYATLNGGKGNDTIYSNGDNSKIDGGAGNDSVYSSGNDNSTIRGGAGNDTITNYNGSNVKIEGGDGNDYISHSSYYSSSVGSGSYYTTLSGGKGDDIIQLSGDNNAVKYASGDGKDIVLGFSSHDILRITKGKYSVKTDANDVIVTVGKGSVTLKGMAGKELSIMDANGKTTTKIYGNASSANISEVWFDDENNSTQDEFASIIENKSVAGLDEFKTSELTESVSRTSLVSGIDYNKN